MTEKALVRPSRPESIALPAFATLLPTMPPAQDCTRALPADVQPSPGEWMQRPLARALAPVLQQAAAEARREGLAFAGHVAPDEAWALASSGQAWLVDVRSPEELRFVGRVPGALAAPWAKGLDLQRNPDFLAQLAQALAEAEGGRDPDTDIDIDTGAHAGSRAGAAGPRPLLLLCRSGVRSIRAAEAATAAGHPAAFNVLEGFEGSLDAKRQRGRLDGWRLRGLPWEQG